MSTTLKTSLDWGKLAPLRLTAHHVAQGAHSGRHLSRHSGSGIEFSRHRDYTPGDDLRHLDWHALMRHDRLLIREFHTETSREVHLIIDASLSMGYHSKPDQPAKLAYAALLAAALARVALTGGDTIALHWLGGVGSSTLPKSGGLEAFEWLVDLLERVEPNGSFSEDLTPIDNTFAPIAQNVPSGSILVIFSDFLDLPEGTLRRISALGSRGRMPLGVQVLDPAEATFPFTSMTRLRATESSLRVEINPKSARDEYLHNLSALKETWRSGLAGGGGSWLSTQTSDDPISALRNALALIGGQRR